MSLPEEPVVHTIGLCSNCKYWDAQDEAQGRCRFSPPTMSTQVGARAGWPITGASDWCGQWVAAEPALVTA